MSITELAHYIRTTKEGLNYPGVHPLEDRSVVLQYSRHAMRELVHITDEHIFECCALAKSYEEHVELCRPFAIVDTEKFHRDRLAPPPKGRTKRRFR